MWNPGTGPDLSPVYSALRAWRPLVGSLGVFLVACGIFAAGASLREPWRTDEHRYIEISRVMAIGEGSWLVPHLNGPVYVSKPPGFFWAVAATHRVLSIELAFAALLPSVLAAALTVALTFALGRRLYGAATGLGAAVVLGSSEMFLSLGLRANLDSLLCLLITAALYSYWRAEEMESSEPAGGRLLLAGGFCAGLGMLVKGPVALAIPTAVVVTDRLLTRGLRGLRDRRLAAALGLSLLPVALWIVPATLEAGTGYARELVLGHGLGHAAGLIDKQRPFWFYLQSFPAGFLPWIVLLPAAAVWLARERYTRAGAFVLAWALAPFVLLSLFPAKRHLYLLPFYPGVALAVGGLLGALVGRARASGPTALRVSWTFGRFVLGVAALALGVAVTIAAGLSLTGFHEMLEGLWPPWAKIRPGSALPLGAALLVGPVMSMSGLAALVGRGARREARACVAVGLSTALLLVGVFHPIESIGNSSASFFRAVEQRVGGQRLMTYGGMDFSTNWMLHRSVVRMLVTEERASRIVAKATEPLWLIAEAREVEDMGAPAGTTMIIRGERPLAADLVLLRSEDPNEMAKVGGSDNRPQGFDRNL